MAQIFKIYFIKSFLIYQICFASAKSLVSLDFGVGDFEVLGQRRLVGLHAQDLLQVGAVQVELANDLSKSTFKSKTPDPINKITA